MNQLDELEKQIKGYYMLLDKENEALKRSERGALLAQAEEWHGAAADFGRIAEIALEVDESVHAAQAFVTQGNMLAQAEAWLDAKNAYEKGADIYELEELYFSAAQAWRQAAGYYVWVQDLDTATTLIERAVDLLDPESADMEERAYLLKLYETLSQIYWSQGDYAAAAEVMEDVQAEFANSDEADSLAQRQHILHGLISGELSLDVAWEQALPLVESMGWVDGDLATAIRAYNGQQWDEVVKATAQSRLNSRQAIGGEQHDQQALLRYLLASMLLADAQDKQGNRVSVLIALLTCRAVLTGHLGEPIGRSLDKVLDSMADRWGSDGMMAAVAGYEAYVAENGVVVA